jgi:spermidine/putrescine transport system ATP-binding protein
MRGAVGVFGLRKSYGDLLALKEVSLDVKPGEFLTLLGPSGCGKTTLLRLLAGFEVPDAGRILISGRDVAPLPPYERPVNTVFQHYALFPHRTVAGNVAFGLESKRLPRDEIVQRVARALEMVRLTGFGERRIDQLSGGQKQRVALARAVIMEPEVLLLDEPMAALDLKLRKEMQVEVKNLQERLQITFVFVTHDQDEALIMSDRIAVLNQGRIEQVGTPEELYERPGTHFVADFLAVKNIFEAKVVDATRGRATLHTLGGLSLLAADDGGYVAGATVSIGIRPERLRLEGDAGTAGINSRHLPEGVPNNSSEPRGVSRGLVENSLAGTLEDEIYLGDSTEWHVRLGELLLIVAEDAVRARNRRRGETVLVSFDPSAVLRLETEP